MLLAVRDRMSKAERAGELDHPYLTSKEMAKNLTSVLAWDEDHMGGPVGCREGMLHLLRLVAEESKKARRKKVQDALEKDIELAAVRHVTPERIQRWWSRARVLRARRNDQESLKALLSSMEKSPPLVRRRSHPLSQKHRGKSPSPPLLWAIREVLSRALPRATLFCASSRPRSITFSWKASGDFSSWRETPQGLAFLN